jgi:hypothetical protein
VNVRAANQLTQCHSRQLTELLLLLLLLLTHMCCCRLTVTVEGNPSNSTGMTFSQPSPDHLTGTTSPDAEPSWFR